MYQSLQKQRVVNQGFMGFAGLFILVTCFSCGFNSRLDDLSLPDVITKGGTAFALKVKANNIEKTYTNDTLKLTALEDDLIFELVPLQAQNQKDTNQVARLGSVKRDSTWHFQLKGLDTGTIKTPYPTIRYTNLKGRQYVFVYALSVNQNLVEQHYIHVEVQQTLGESQWFYPFLIIFIIIIISVVVYVWSVYEFRQKFKIANIRNRIAGDLHDEIGSDLGSAVLSIKTVQNKYAKNHSELNETLEEIKKEIKETSITLRDSVWLIQPNNDSFEKLFDKIYGFARRILSAEQIELTYNNQIQGQKDWKISMERRRNVYLIIREAIHNIVKHAQATRVNIAINREEEGVRVLIEDNGIGFNEDELEDSGNGLLNFRQRAMESFIEFDLKSTPSVGTTISMFIPEF